MQRVTSFVLVAACALALAGGAIAKKEPSNSDAGTGTVFVPGPVSELGNQGLTDQKDADYPALAPAYHNVQLTELDGSGFLRGRWAQIVSETGDSAYSPTNTFRYARDDDRFEQVMAYYWITEAQQYIQSLGFGAWLRPVNMASQRVRINQWGVDNSFATDHPKNELRFGKGGVDDAEDAEVVLHEYGHAIHFSQGFAFASTEAGAISEGFADYWAVTVSEHVRQSLGVALNAPAACVADWDSVSYTSTVPHCLRRVDTSLHYPEDLDGRVHHDGMIWSRALWDIRQALGPLTADTLILEGQFDFAGTTMPQLAGATVAAADHLFNPAVAGVVEDKFEDRGIL